MNPSDFESLKPDEQAKIFHQTSFKERGELLRYSHQPERLVRSLSQEEFYLLTREMDLEEKAEVVRYAQLSQLVFMADVDCWKEDRLEPKKFAVWLETLESADDRKLFDWLVESDYEAVVTGFKKIVGVLKPDREYAMDEILGDRPYFTIDQMYYVVVDEDNMQTVRRALEILFENNRGRYFALLEGIMSELDDELEEEAFRRREMRLAERGFPDFETAHQLLRPMTRVEFEKYPAKRPPEETPASPLPGYPVLWGRSGLFLDEVLERLRGEPSYSFEQLQEEMAWISNKVIALEGIDFSSEEKVRKGAERARFYVSIGLENLSGRKIEEGVRLLKERWLETIFRWGISQALRVREEALAVMNDCGGPDAARGAFTNFLNPPYDSVFRGLFQTVPQHYDSAAGDVLAALRDFATLTEISAARLAVEQIGAILHSPAGLIPEGALVNAGAENHKTLFSFLGTLFASFASGEPAAQFVSEKTLQHFLSNAFESRGTRRVLKNGLREKFIRFCFPEAPPTDMRGFWGLFFDELEDELGGLDPAQPVNPEFISVVRVKRQQNTVRKRRSA